MNNKKQLALMIVASIILGLVINTFVLMIPRTVSQNCVSIYHKEVTTKTVRASGVPFVSLRAAMPDCIDVSNQDAPVGPKIYVLGAVLNPLIWAVVAFGLTFSLSKLAKRNTK